MSSYVNITICNSPPNLRQQAPAHPCVPPFFDGFRWAILMLHSMINIRSSDAVYPNPAPHVSWNDTLPSHLGISQIASTCTVTARRTILGLHPYSGPPTWFKGPQTLRQAPLTHIKTGTGRRGTFSVSCRCPYSAKPVWRNRHIPAGIIIPPG